MRTDRIRRTAACGMFAALASVLLVLGSLVDVLDLSCAAAASLAVVYARIEYGAKWSAAVWLCASVVSLLLFPRSAPLLFALFAGPYPLFKAFAERRTQVVSWVCKLLFFNLALTAVLVVGVYLLGLEDFFGFTVVVYAAGNALFVLFDIALTQLISVYYRRFRR